MYPYGVSHKIELPGLQSVYLDRAIGLQLGYRSTTGLPGGNVYVEHGDSPALLPRRAAAAAAPALAPTAPVSIVFPSLGDLVRLRFTAMV